jgi:hypothetical protein
MQEQLISLYQSYCNYQIVDGIQKLDVPIDFDLLYQEISNFIIKNKFGFDPVSLRITSPSRLNQDYINENEHVIHTGIPKGIDGYTSSADNTIPDQNYVHWHPDLEGSYTQSLVDKLEKFSNFPIGRIRLAWLMPNSGYTMHLDLEPMRFHIPIITNKHCYFIQDDSLYHMENGNLYHILTASEHAVQNYGKAPRLHLIYSTYYADNLKNQVNNFFTQEKFNELYYDHLASLDSNSIQTLIKIVSHVPANITKPLHLREILRALLTNSN